MLDKDIISQVKTVFASLGSDFVFRLSGDPSLPKTKEMLEFLTDVVSCSPRLAVEMTDMPEVSPRFSLWRDGAPTGITFRRIPGGHEFTPLLLAVLNADGKGKNLPDEATASRIKSLKGEIEISVFVSLDCTNCPDVVQALNVIALNNPALPLRLWTATPWFREAKALHAGGVPTVFANGVLLHVGRSSLGELLALLEERFGTDAAGDVTREVEADLIVIGGGPPVWRPQCIAHAKALRVAVVAGTIGGQVRETKGIENLISSGVTTGMDLCRRLACES